MRLIDADKLMDSLRGNVLVDVTPTLEDAIAEQPTAFDVDAVLAELEKRISIQLKIIAGLSDPVYMYGYAKSLEAYQQCKLLLDDLIN